MRCDVHVPFLHCSVHLFKYSLLKAMPLIGFEAEFLQIIS